MGFRVLVSLLALSPMPSIVSAQNPLIQPQIPLSDPQPVQGDHEFVSTRSSHIAMVKNPSLILPAFP